MGGLAIMIVAFVGYIIAYQLYGRFIGKKIFALSNANKTPAIEFEDGTDYVPTRKEIIFGHHYASIAGTGPIVGPAIAIIWGWVPAMIWIFVGSIIMGGVQDFGALIISMRNQGKSIAEYTAKYVNSRTRFLFFIIVFLEVWIVVAVFGLIIALIFNMFPQSVIPIWCEIPIAVILGYMVYKKGMGVWLWSIVAVAVMYLTVVIGAYVPVKLPDTVLGLPAHRRLGDHPAHLRLCRLGPAGDDPAATAGLHQLPPAGGGLWPSWCWACSSPPLEGISMWWRQRWI